MQLLPEEAQRRGPLSDGQIGNRKGQSGINAVDIMVDSAHAAWTNRHISGMILRDIKEAFSSVAKGKIANLTKVRQMNKDHIQWTEIFESERPVKMIMDGNTLERHPVECGVLKG